MKKLVVFGVLALFLGGVVLGLYLNPAVAASIKEQIFGGGEPDIPDFAIHKVDKQEFMLRRSENIALYRGLDKERPVDPQLRVDAIRQMERQQEDLANSLSPQAAWVEIGPNPIPNAQVETPPTTPASGRTIAIAVHPTNPDIVYVGTAMGGLYRSLDGGTTWTRLTETALSLAIGAIAIAPSQPDTIYVGTGEPNFSGDSFFGVGVYRIDNASTTANLTGPLNDDPADVDIFTGRAIGEIVVHPTNPATIFVATTSGVGGIGGVQNNVLPSRGIYRSTDATSADPTFTKLTGLEGGGNFSVRDMAIDPLNANLLVCNLIANGGGIYVSTDALAPSPTFVRRVTFTSTSTSELTAEFAIQHTAGLPNPTIYAATGNLGGRVLINTDGGTTWTQQIDNNFCTPQCFYDIGVAVDPNNAANVYLGGSPQLVFGRSTDSGATFTGDGVPFTAGLHVDSHAIAIAPSLPRVAYFGSDGGIYKTNDVNATPIVWANLNNTQFTATQFMGLAVHSTDPNFTIGGTQDNGTNFYRPDATWFRVDFGDGGYAVIDQSSASVVAVNMYHTYFNASTLKGYGFNPSPNTAFENWVFRGCNGVAGNGIPCGGNVLFYAPLEQGPGTPNTTYYGADTLYRSADTGLNHTAVSQNFVNAISAIGISPQNDNVRMIGTRTGQVFGTTTGANPMLDLDPTNVIPDNFVARTVIDPNNVNTAYVTLNGFGLAANVYKTTTLSSLHENGVAPTWTASSTGLPAVPVNGFIVDPIDSSRLYAGTDIGVYTSGDGGANWTPFGTDLPRVAVFDLAKTSGNLIRIATHGRGMWQIAAVVPTAANVSVSGRVMASDGRGLRNALVTLTDSAGVSRQAVTSSFGYYRLDDVPVGETYVATVTSRRFSYAPQFITLLDELADLDFTPAP